jgi:hypothetical protein
MTEAAAQRHLAGFARMTPGLALLVQDFHVFAAVPADALAALLLPAFAYLAEAGLAGEAEFGIDVGQGEGALVALLAVAEALSDHALVLNADFLEAGFALVAFGFFPGSVVADGRVRTALGTHHQEFPALQLLILEELLDDAGRDEGYVKLGTHHA